MSRQETDREDLLREATALVHRAELRLKDAAEPVVVGFRRTGCASFFFGADPVVQFNTAGELRRLYVAGELLKADTGRLVALRRDRMADATILLRQELSDARHQEILGEIERQMGKLQQALSAGEFELVGQVPANAEVIPQILRWLADYPFPWAIARVPNAV